MCNPLAFPGAPYVRADNWDPLREQTEIQDEVIRAVLQGGLHYW